MASSEILLTGTCQSFQCERCNILAQGSFVNCTFHQHLVEDHCLKDLYCTDPIEDKKRIEDTKGGLLEDSYGWILNNQHFQQWRDDDQCRLLWIKGDPGKGKTMLLCGIIDQLSPATKLRDSKADELMAFFFCQATDLRINNATAVLRGLIYLLVLQQPPLLSYVRKKYDRSSGKEAFKGVNAWVALSEIFANILQDPSLGSAYLIVDALDECATELPKLLHLIVLMSSTTSRVKWIVSSRNEAHIKKGLEQKLQLNGSRISLSLELKENAALVSRAVDAYIDHCLSQLPEIKHDTRLRDRMQQKANGTFLWVSLVVEELKKMPEGLMAWEAWRVVKEVPTELNDAYRRMVKKITQLQRDYPELCRQVLSTVLATYRPLRLEELHVLSGLPTEVRNVKEATKTIVMMCGSFLTVREDNVYIIHQSAQDFLFNEATHKKFPWGIGDVHYSIFSKSLQVMSKSLQRDMYSLRALGYPSEQVKQPDSDPLASSRYSCVYWVDHLHNAHNTNSLNFQDDLRNNGILHTFLKEKYLYWLEALSLCKSMPKGIVSMKKLEAFMQRRTDARALNELVRDARRFIMSHRWAIENSPLQAYASALLFSPAHSLIRGLFKEEEPKWITMIPAVGESWSACLQTLEGHSDQVYSVAFSSDSSRLASGSVDTTIKIWDESSGECLQTLKGHSHSVNLVAFSHDSTRLASASDNTIKIWDTNSGECLQTLKDHNNNRYNSVAFSHDSAWLASASCDYTVKIWDASSGKCLKTLKDHNFGVTSVAFSHDSTRLASASADSTVKIWDVGSGKCLHTLVDHSNEVWSVAFSHDSARLASASHDRAVKIWDASSGKCLKTLKDHNFWVTSVAFSHDSTRLASASADSTVKIWDVGSGKCLQTLEGHNIRVNSVAFSHDSTRLASASSDNTVKIWDAGSSKYPQMLEGHNTEVNPTNLSQGASSGMHLQMLDRHKSWVCSVTFSPNLAWFVSASDDRTVKIWDVSNGKCLQTLQGHTSSVWSVAFSPNSTYLASASAEADRTVKIWDARDGVCVKTLQGHSHSVLSVTFSPDSTRLASGSHDNTVKIWDTRHGRCINTLDNHHAEVRSVAFSSDSSRLASGSADYTVKIWDASNGACFKTLEGHGNRVNSVAFSHDSTQLASASDDKTVKIWNADNGACLQTLEIGNAIFHISFNVIGSCLHTDIGSIPINELSVSYTSSNMRLQVPRYQGWGLSSDRRWITFDSEKLIWIPSEYRPSHSAVSAKMVGIGVGTGKVWMCSFDVKSS